VNLFVVARPITSKALTAIRNLRSAASLRGEYPGEGDANDALGSSFAGVCSANQLVANGSRVRARDRRAPHLDALVLKLPSNDHHFHRPDRNSARQLRDLLLQRCVQLNPYRR
jgi:hypothetical protein